MELKKWEYSRVLNVGEDISKTLGDLYLHYLKQLSIGKATPASPVYITIDEKQKTIGFTVLVKEGDL